MEGKFLDGGSIYLRAANEKDLKGNWYSWLNDPVVTRFQNKGIFPNTRDKQRDYYHVMINSKNDVLFAIVEKKSKKHIGSAGLHKIDWVHRSAELGIVIGEKAFWGKGYGKVAWNLVTFYGFKKLNLHRIYAVVVKKNSAAIKSGQASGFKIEGQMRDVYFKNGRYYSTLLMSALENEFKSLVKEIH